MKLVNAYGSKVTRIATGLVSCPCCKMRRRRDRAWYMVTNMKNVGILMTCPKCWYDLNKLHISNIMNTVRDSGWWIISSSLREYDFRTYYLLTKEVGFGDYKEKDRWKNFKQVAAS